VLFLLKLILDELTINYAKKFSAYYIKMWNTNTRILLGLLLGPLKL